MSALASRKTSIRVAKSRKSTRIKAVKKSSSTPSAPNAEALVEVSSSGEEDDESDVVNISVSSRDSSGNPNGSGSSDVGENSPDPQYVISIPKRNYFESQKHQTHKMMLIELLESRNSFELLRMSFILNPPLLLDCN